MGQALIIENSNFSSHNLGKITFGKRIPLVNLAISGDSTISRETANYTVTYNPTNTTDLGVIWSIVSGNEYASINSSTGVLTVLDRNSQHSVTIRCTSAVDSSIYDEKNITIEAIMRNLLIVGPDTIKGDVRAGNYFLLDVDTMKQVVGTSTEVIDDYKEYLGTISWAVTSGSNYCEFANETGTEGALNILSGASSANVSISATVAGTTNTKSLSVTYDMTDYKISSFADLQELERVINNKLESTTTLSKNPNSSYSPVNGGGFSGAHFRLTNDIDCENSHVEIGQYNASKSIDKYFAGIFDGAGYKLYNIGGAAGVNGSAAEGGLVGSILIGNLKDGTVRNLELYGSVTHSTVRGMGGVCAFVGGNCKIENVYNACDYTYNSITAATMDLFAGWANNITPTLNIKDCIYAGIATNVRQIPGFGISHTGTSISRCANIGKLTVEYGQVTGYTTMAGIGDTAVSPLETLTSCYQIMGMRGLSKGSVGDGPGNRQIGGKITNGYEATVCIGDMESGICSNYAGNTNTYTQNTWTNGTAKTATELKNNLSFSTASDWIQSDGFYPINNNQWAVKALVLDRCKNGYVESE